MKRPSPLRPAPATVVVSSSHLAEGAMPALSEIEFSLHLAVTAYHRWLEKCMAASGKHRLSVMEVLVLHTVRHRDRAKRMADIALVLDIEETHVLTYALRKLEQLGLVETERDGKEKLVRISADGRALCDRYAELREAVLVEPLKRSTPNTALMSEAAALLRVLSGAYNQAARSAATI